MDHDDDDGEDDDDEKDKGRNSVGEIVCMKVWRRGMKLERIWIHL